MRFKDIIFSGVYKGPSAFGLDISDFSIKIAQLEKEDNGFKLRNFNRISVPAGIVKEGEVKKEERLVEIIKKVINEAKGEPIRIPYAVCSLPEQHGFIKVIQLPQMKLKEAKEAIKWEAEANIPLSLEEVYLDWEIISSKNERLNVLINAVPKDLADKYLQVLRAAGVEPVIFEIESLATARSLIKKEFTLDPVLIIDLGFSRTSFIIFVENNIPFTSSIPISNQEMIDNIAKKLGVSKAEAQSLKFKIGIDRTKEKGKVFSALLPSLTKLIDKINDCMTFYKEHSYKFDHQKAISKIMLCGGGAYLNNLPEYLSTRLKIPVELGNPWINILPAESKAKLPNIFHKESLAYSTALGLALRGIGL